MTPRTASGFLLLCLLVHPARAADPAAPVTGTVRFEPGDDAAAGVPERYRLPARTFEYKLGLRFELRHSGVDVYDLTFPSPVVSGIPVNDVVHAEYFVPREVTGKV